MMTLPMAPSDGLFLDKAYFDLYNVRATEIGSGSSLDWEGDARARAPPPPAVIRERIQAFKAAEIVAHITRSEATTLAFPKWLYHTRHRYEKQPNPWVGRELTVAEQRSEAPKKVIQAVKMEKKRRETEGPARGDTAAEAGVREEEGGKGKGEKEEGVDVVVEQVMLAAEA